MLSAGNSPYQVITDSWTRCRFGSNGSSGDLDGDGAAKGVTVEDRGSGQTLAKFSPASGTGLGAGALGLLLPAEASS